MNDSNENQFHHHCRHRHHLQQPPQCSHSHYRHPKHGIIYFRAIEPCDRCAIQKLHQLWFPVDYTPDFFDMLCGCDATTSSNFTTTARAGNNVTSNEAEDDDAGGEGGEPQRQRFRQKQKIQHQKGQPPPKMNSFYTCVACYKELNDDEFYNYQMLLLQRN